MRWTLTYVVVVCFALVWCRLSVVQASFRLGELQKQEEGLLKEQASTIASLTRMQSPERLRQYAQGFGLKAPTSAQVIYIVESHETDKSKLASR